MSNINRKRRMEQEGSHNLRLLMIERTLKCYFFQFMFNPFARLRVLASSQLHTHDWFLGRSADEGTAIDFRMSVKDSLPLDSVKNSRGSHHSLALTPTKPK